MNINLKNLEFFLTTSELGSINKAASKLFISPQGLSRIIGSLEQELNVKLLVRNTHGIQLTAHGKILQKYAEKIIAQASELKSELGFVEEEEHSQLWIVFSYAILEYLGFDFLNCFRLNNSEIDLMMGEYPYSFAERLILEGKFDFAFGYTPIDTKKFHYLHLKTARWPLLVHQSNPLAKKSRVTIRDLAGQDFFMMSSNFKGREIFLERCQELNLYPNVVGTVNNLSETYQLVKEKRGVAFSILGIEKRVRDPDVMTIYLDDEKCKSDMIMFYQKDALFTPAAQKFYDYIKETVSQWSLEPETVV